MPPRSKELVTSYSTPSPDSEPLLRGSQDKFLAEREWHRQIVSQSLSLQTPKASTTPEIKPPTANTQKSTPPSAPASSPPSALTSQTTSSKSSQQNKETKVPKANKQQASKSPASSKSQAQLPDLSQNPPSVEIRVALAQGVSSLVVATSTPGELVNENGKVVDKLPANKGTNVQPNGSKIRIDDVQIAKGVWLKPTQGGHVFVGNRWYRGDVLLVSLGDTLLAVNYVDLESYLKGVVAAEMPPSWPMEALKAQAIAARSYAIVHALRPAHALYDLGNTQRWQVYKGVESEWNTTSQAVQETTGIFLSYKGGVVESMYAASENIVTNVFGGRGMSQEGAKDLAQDGYNHQEILANYYPGTGLGWIEDN
ncbi:SpoIID/LytB domain-containing protein [Lyngbya aestuarii]|uniref:SpoIID/LytB domain-containing protein n=1 Tax=Lyngbya aestuarii TaxID=118322 RepID=UPI00403D874F